MASLDLLLESPVWVKLYAMAAILFGLSLFSRDRLGIMCSGIILCAYTAMQLKKVIFPSSEFYFAISMAIWVISAGAIQRQVVYNDRQKLRTLTQVQVLMVLSGLCYFWARVVNAPRMTGSPPYVTADVLLILAMLLIGWSLRHGLLRRIRSLGSGYQLRSSDSGGRNIASSYTMGGEEDWPQKVGRHG